MSYDYFWRGTLCTQLFHCCSLGLPCINPNFPLRLSGCPHLLMFSTASHLWEKHPFLSCITNLLIILVCCHPSVPLLLINVFLCHFRSPTVTQWYGSAFFQASHICFLEGLWVISYMQLLIKEEAPHHLSCSTSANWSVLFSFQLSSFLLSQLFYCHSLRWLHIISIVSYLLTGVGLRQLMCSTATHWGVCQFRCLIVTSVALCV